MQSEIKLKPCPFCGGNGANIKKLFVGDVYYVACVVCHATSHAFDKPENAATAWNRRAEPENRVLTLEEVKAHCEGGVDAAPLWVEFDEGLSRWVQIAPHEPGCELEYVSVFVSIMWPQYGKGWRCWLRKPTEEETAGTPWNEKGGTEK